MRIIWVAILFSLNLQGAHQNLECARSCDDGEACKRRYFIGTKKIDFYSNFPLDQPNGCIEKVIFVVHGAERNALSRYRAVLNAAKSQNLQDRLLIISPYFKTLDDAPASNDYYWSSGWRQGDTSNNDGTQISSFTVADSILHTVISNGKFSLLKNVAVTGHSAGGQFAQMFGLTTLSPNEHLFINYQFLVLNPSNYTYLDSRRPHPSIDNYFEVPIYYTGSSWKMKPLYKSIAGNCPSSYNNYKYGLEKRNSYANRLSSSTLISQYLNRKVYYFLGELDTVVDDSLDTSCEAKLQGPHRLKRGKNYFSFLSKFNSNNLHTLRVVPGVGHDAKGMYGSSEVTNVLLKW